jgi:hypothetical protein
VRCILTQNASFVRERPSGLSSITPKRRRNVNATLWRSRVARLVALAMIVALCPAFAFAAPPGTPDKATPIKSSAAKIAASVRLETAAAPAAAQATTGETKGSPSFFRRPLGVAVLATLGAGFGYAIYSAKHDRVHSAGKK